MRCIFCKQESTSSKSVEHIIPESLGNNDYVLLPGVVCDTCNNYFSRKLEKPLLDSDYFIHMRLDMGIPNKRGLTPCITGFHLESATILKINSNDETIFATREKDFPEFAESILEQKTGHIVILVPSVVDVDRYIMSRFLGKIAIEALSLRLNTPEGLNEIVDKQELDHLRKYVRFGNPKLVWQFHERQIYPPDQLFFVKDVGLYEVLHEWNFFYLDNDTDLYFALIIFGREYVLNMDRPVFDPTKLPCPNLPPDSKT